MSARFRLSPFLFLTAALLALPPSLTAYVRSAAALDSVTCLGGKACLDQGWDDLQRNWWYRASQGSRLLPLDWFKALERHDGSELIASDANMARLGYLPEAQSPENPAGLPVGFTVDQDTSDAADIMCDTFPNMCEHAAMRRKWVGLNCSACHTNDIEFGGTRIRVDGAPTLADFQGLEEQLLAALKAARDDAGKFDRFSKAVLGELDEPDARKGLKAEIEEQIAWQQKLHDKNDAPVRYGHGRLDAQGHILNKVALTTRPQNLTSDILADAPASYPFIWNTSQQTKIQWNGIASNKVKIPFFGLDTDLGALVRNTSEVIGVFAHMETDGQKARRGYRSSARVKALIGLERQLATLQSPQWPEDVLGALDQARVLRGKALFNGPALKCSTCHDHLAPTDVKTHMNERMDRIQDQKTDIFLACNTFYHRSAAGSFKGQNTFIIVGPEIRQEDWTRNLLINATFGTILGKKNELADGIFNDVFSNGRGANAAPPQADVTYLPGVTNQDKVNMARDCLTTDIKKASENILAYKSRSLNGIWATAPYLHNGSVPTLYDLLSTTDLRLQSNDPAPPPGATEPRRPDSFRVGSRRYDPVKAGFITDNSDPANNFEFNVRVPGTKEPIPGNYNSGHDYGTSKLSQEQRMDLVEYLKSL